MDAYGLTLRGRNGLLTTSESGAKQTQITIPTLFCPPGTATLFFSFAYERKLMVIFTVKSEARDLT